MDAAANTPVKHSGLELARANIDTPIEKIAMERGGQKAVDQVSFMAMGKTPRQLSEQYGGMFMDRAEPLFKSLGITRQDFDKAASMPSTKQDIKMRFAEMPDADVLSAAQGGEKLPAGVKRLPNGDIVASNYWQAPKEGTPEWNQQVYEPMAGSMIMRRPENQTIGGASKYNDFRRSEDLIDRRDVSLTPEQRTALPPAQYYADPEPAAAASNPLALGLGLGDRDLPMPRGMSAATAARPQPFTGEGGTEDLWGDVPVFDAGGTSMRNFQSPANDYSMFQQPASRADLASLVADPNRVKMDFSGFSPSPEPRQGGVGPEMEAPTPEFMQTIAKVESDFNPNQKTGSYKGLYQLSDEEFRRYGGQGSIFNPDENARVASAKMMAEGQRAQDRLGRALTPVEQYMVHQQGLAGTLSHLANPDQPAWKSFQQAASSSEDKAKSAIWKNMTPEMKNQFGNDVNNVTSRDFIKLWTDRYNALQRPG